MVYHPYLADQSTIDDLIDECDPKVHTIRWIAITFLVTSCEFEERISTIGLLKSDFRSSMAKKMLTEMCLMSAHRVRISTFMFSKVFYCRFILFSKAYGIT